MKRARKPIRVQDADTVATLLLAKPGSTGAQLARASGIPSVTRVITAMKDEFGYVFAKGWKKVDRKGGGGKRRVRTYFILKSPPKPQLELSLEG
jgi:hypothetical protein